MSPNLIEIVAPYRFMVGSWSGIGGLTLCPKSSLNIVSKQPKDDHMSQYTKEEPIHDHDPIGNL